MILSKKHFKSCILESHHSFAGSDYLYKTFLILIFIIPVFYAFGRISGNSIFYGVKDLFFLPMLMLLLFMRFSYSLIISAIILMLVNIYALGLVTESYLLYLLSVREFFMYPLLGIFLGYFFFKKNGAISLFKISVVYLIMTYVYFLTFPDESFGSTNRLHSLWDREHEPAIIGGVVFLGAFFLLRKAHFRNLVLLLSLGLILFSGSRSGLIGIAIAIFLIYLKEFSIKNIFLLALFVFLVINFFSFLTVSDRAIDHNLSARLNQYVLAYDAIVNSSFLGIGSDKYGVVSGIVHKEYCLGGHCTTTMDSSLIKYLVNYGIFFAALLFAFLAICGFLFFKYSRSPTVNYILSIVIFSLVIGLFTGKLGAFPMNLFFYMAVGSVFYILKLKRCIQ